jgi:hypothetical protein
VCGTSLRSTQPLRQQRYLFYPDHTSLYSPEALQLLADATGFHLDLRHPEGLGPRKRYVLLTRSEKTRALITRYFGYHAFAPSERSLAATGSDTEDDTQDDDDA